MHEQLSHGRKSTFDNLTRKSALVIALAVSPFFFVFTFLGDPGRGRVAAICAGVLLTCIILYWDLRKRYLFWLAAFGVFLCHIPLVLFFPWTNKDYPGPVLLPGALSDFAIVYGAFKLVDKFNRAGGEADDAKIYHQN
jgi:hypothetical protein